MKPSPHLDRLKSRLRELTALNAISSVEKNVAQFMHDTLKPLADEVTADAYGNVFAVRRGKKPGPKFMIAPHSDEVGLMVRSITPDGFLKFHTIGAISSAILPATRVVVDETIPGTVATVAGHLEAEIQPRVRPVSELHIDVGASSEAEARAWGIREGTPVNFVSPLVELRNPELVMGKSIDNRIGCTILLDVFERMKGVAFEGEIWGVVNVMEEMGLRGARMATARVKPDWAIAIDTIPSEDTPLSEERSCSIGKGPVLQVIEGRAEAFIGSAMHPKVRDLILDTAKQEGIAVQFAAQYGKWVTDSAAIHVSGEGVPCACINIPRRYSHSPNELMNLNDAVHASHLLLALVKRNSAKLSFRIVE